MENKNIKYIAAKKCSATKYQIPHIIKSYVIIDQEFENRIKDLMESEYYLTELEFS